MAKDHLVATCALRKIWQHLENRPLPMERFPFLVAEVVFCYEPESFFQDFLKECCFTDKDT